MKTGIPEWFKKAVKDTRDVKERAKEFGVTVKGSSDSETKISYRETEEEFQSLVQKHASWVYQQDIKIQTLLPECSTEEIDAAFMEGLFLLVKEEHRLFKKEGDAHGRAELHTETKIDELIAGYAFDFIQIIKRLSKEGIAQKSILKIAKLSYWNTSDTFTTLQKKYPTINENVLVRAMIGVPYAPEEYLAHYIQIKTDLRNTFSDVDESIIDRAANGFADIDEAKKFINQYKVDFANLKIEFPKVKEQTLIHAALYYPSNPAAYVRQVLGEE